MDLSGLLTSVARKFPRKEALVAGDERYTYLELLEASRRAAAVFRDCGVTRGERVAVMTYNTPGFVLAAFGLWHAGAVLVPVNHKLTARELGYVAEHSGIRVGVVAASLLTVAREAAPHVRWLATEDVEGIADAESFDSMVAAAVPWEGVEVEETDIGQVLYTSGTTSNPKGCLHTHRSLTTVPLYTTPTVGLRHDDRFLIAMPIWHASPLNNWLLSMVLLGGTIVLLREYHPIEFLKAVERERVTAFFGPAIAYLAPIQATKANGLDLGSFDLSSVRLWIAGGAPIGEQTVRILQSAYPGGEFHQVYGMSEMGPVGTALGPSDQAVKAGSIGNAGMVGVDVRVVVDDGRDALPGEAGEIWLMSDTRMVGYLGDDEATAAAFEGPWYKTGDIAVIDEDGYMFIVDRTKDVIITGGENVYSLEVEDAVRTHPAIADVAVIGRPHADWGETIVAVVVPADEGVVPTLEELRQHLADQLAAYKIPRELVVRAALPRNPSGKVTKHLLRAELTAPA